MKKTSLTAERLKQVVSYDPASGVFTWAVQRGRCVVGAVAGSLDPNGYRYLKIDGQWYLAQKLAWLYVNGEWPQRYVRFKDSDTGNCAINNLHAPEAQAYDVKLEKDRRRFHSNPERHRNYDLNRDFGISLEQYQAAFVAQGGVCACCAKPEVSERSGKRKWLAVDHDHTDHSFRGLLCSSCNNMLGRAKDNAETLRRAADYLEAHAAKSKTNVIPLSGRRIAGEK